MKLMIYVPDVLAAKIVVLPKGSVSGICQRALLAEVGGGTQRDEVIAEAFAED